MIKGTLSKNIIAYPAVETDRDKLIAMFESMKTSSKDDRFQYIRQWHGTDEVEPIDLTAGLANQADTTTDTKVTLPAGNQLQEPVNNGSNVGNGL